VAPKFAGPVGRVSGFSVPGGLTVCLPFELATRACEATLGGAGWFGQVRPIANPAINPSAARPVSSKTPFAVISYPLSRRATKLLRPMQGLDESFDSLLRRLFKLTCVQRSLHFVENAKTVVLLKV
jgi:hypothetical protein